jgi:hypothetical protein
MVLPGQIRQREGRAWLVRWQGARGILRQLPAAVPGALAGQAAADLAWLHAFLSRLDLSRVSRFLRGYAGVARVPADDARVIAVYMRGRGLQMIAKRVRAGRAETGMLAQVQWLTANEDDISDALTAAVG